MMAATATPPTIPGYESLAAMQAAHATLLEGLPCRLDAPKSAIEIIDFLRRGAAAGKFLDLAGERIKAQGLLDYWSGKLHASSRSDPAISMEAETSFPSYTDTILLPFDLGAGDQILAQATAWLDRVPEEKVNLARRILLRLLTLSDDASSFVPVVLERAVLHTLGDPAAVDEIITGLTNVNIIRCESDPVTASETVHLAYEPISRLWKTYKELLDQRRRFRAMAEYWVNVRDDSLLVSGPLLDAAQSYHDLNSSEREFVERCREAAEAALREEQARQQKLERIRRERLVYPIIVALIGTLCIVVVLFSAYSQLDRAYEKGKLRRGSSVRDQDEREKVESFAVALYDHWLQEKSSLPADLEGREPYYKHLKERVEARKALRDNTDQLIPGSYIGLAEFGYGGGSVCCVLRKKREPSQRFILTADYVVNSEKGQRVLWGPPTRPEIGTVKVVDKDIGYALIELDPEVKASNLLVIEKPKAIRGIDGLDVEKGAKVFLIGSGSGKSEEEEVKAVRAFRVDEPALREKYIVTHRLAEPKDAGAPVLTSDGRLIGMLYVSYVSTYEPKNDESWVVPIGAIVKDLEKKSIGLELAD